MRRRHTGKKGYEGRDGELRLYLAQLALNVTSRILCIEKKIYIYTRVKTILLPAVASVVSLRAVTIWQ